MKAQTSLPISTVLPEPWLFAHMKYGSRQMVQSKIRHLAPLNSCTWAFEFMEDEKCHNFMRWLKYGKKLETKSYISDLIEWLKNH